MNQVIPQKYPQCKTCINVLLSHTSSSGLRCGKRFFTASLFIQKISLMTHYPEVEEWNACENWTIKKIKK